MQSEWDENKNKANIERHGISFALAKEIFDGFTVSRIDDRYDYGEIREVSLGKLEKVVVISVVHTDRDGVCRIISARPAKKSERKIYEEEIRKAFNA